MAKKRRSPRISAPITAENWERAKQSKSGGCLVADAIKAAYPQFSRVEVDTATVRCTDPAAGQHYIYLTPESAKLALFYFDQGWKQPVEEVKMQRAVQVSPIRRNRKGPGSVEGVLANRAARLAELAAKEAAGEPLTRYEKAARTRMLKAVPPIERPSAVGPTEVRIENGQPVVYGGVRPPSTTHPKRPKNPNLLAGRDRHFGAKLAKAGQVFEEAVEEAVEAEIAARVAAKQLSATE